MSSPPASPYSHTLAKTWDERANSDLFSLRDHLRHLQEERRQNADQTLALAELDEIIDRRIEARFRKMAEIEAPRPLLQRKADVVYLIFFVTHLPVMFRTSCFHLDLFIRLLTGGVCECVLTYQSGRPLSSVPSGCQERYSAVGSDKRVLHCDV